MTPALSAVLPEGSVVTAVLPRTGGSMSTVWEVRRAGAEPLIVKQYAAEWRRQQAKEVYVYSLATAVSAVPRVVRADYERAMTVLTLLPGRPLWERESEPGTVLAAYRRMGAFLAELHRVRLPAYGELETGIVVPVPGNAEFMRRRFVGHLHNFRAAGGPADIHDAVERIAAAAAPIFATCSGAVLCHADLHEGNVLVDDSGAVTGFVDVENAIAADPMLDLAKTLQFDTRESPAKRAALLDGYGPLPPRGAERIELYRLYHAVELWTWYTSVGHTKDLAGLLDSLRANIARRSARRDR
ncbi:aminoglycoside phosphotransferase family protein [Dactylosporangium matsuzakiense]|uniref:Aminoglycoside phosphotransferase domain-containing protein n=1 Tax=Dactylosporangium matsuzakiense TaxID=53360 RepID=A0A9W6KQ04_9ACTN|nr:aminoglycoside phosphotransferase family protein [Dactylosporangium matsuzakiense]UWZ47955.1 aminoglycoside phosphotransferase family protein [Dactylosporangium matsuzakiense]GLL04295.1 hypothetical protein GCM10017581_060420 [Dactylosporangium matsuzakiense]